MADRTDVQLGLSDNELGLSDYSLQTGSFGSYNLRISSTRPTLDITLKIQHASSGVSVYCHWMATGSLWTHHPFGAKWQAWWRKSFAEGLLVPKVMLSPQALMGEGTSLFSDNPSGPGCNQVLLR